MTGCVFKRTLKSGHIAWGYSIDAGKDENGKRKQIFKSGFERKGDAANELAKLLIERNDGGIVKADPRTLGEFVEAWLAEYAEVSCAPKTAERYREMMVHITAAIGKQTLAKLTTLQLQRVYNELLKTGKKHRAKRDTLGKVGPIVSSPLSIKTVRNIHGAVHVALETAVDWGLLRINPASRCKLPPAPKREARALDFSSSRKLLEVAADHWLNDFVIVSVGSGARRGEMLALSWSDVGPESRSITIRRSLEETRSGLRIKETKGRNVRPVPLADDARLALERVRASQAEKRKAFGSDYRKDLDLVFCEPDGNHYRPRAISKAIRRLIKKAGFTGASLHTLRHSYGSQLLSAGVALPTVSKILGHSDVYTTARVYAHALENDEASAAEKWQTRMKRAETPNVVEISKKRA